MEGVFACVLYKNMDHAGRALLIYHVGKERPKAWKEFSKTVLSLGKLYMLSVQQQLPLKDDLDKGEIGHHRVDRPYSHSMRACKVKTSILLCSIWSNFPALWPLSSFLLHIWYIINNHTTKPSCSVLRIYITNLFMKEGEMCCNSRRLTYYDQIAIYHLLTLHWL